jgi:hypothetical protein
MSALVVSVDSAKPVSVHIAAEGDWYSYPAKRGVAAEGRLVDIAKAAYEAAGANVKLAVLPFNRGFILTKSGQCNGCSMQA